MCTEGEKNAFATSQNGANYILHSSKGTHKALSQGLKGEKSADWWSSVCEINIALTTEKFNNHAQLCLPCVVSN